MEQIWKSCTVENDFYTASDHADGHACKMTIQDSEIVSVNAAGGLYTVKDDGLWRYGHQWRQGYKQR